MDVNKCHLEKTDSKESDHDQRNRKESTEIIDGKDECQPVNPKEQNLTASPCMNASGGSRREETVIEKLKDFGTNFKFTMGGLTDTFVWRAKSSDKAAYLLGQKYETSNNDVRDALEKDFSKLVWFSYRKNFPKIDCDKKISGESAYVSDTGWGCMVRCCQMAFMQALKMSFSLAKLNTDLYEMISWFLDEKDAPFSVHRICSKIFTNYGQQPGWYNASTVFHAIKSLHSEHEKVNRNLELAVFVDGCIYLDQLKNLPIINEESKETKNSFDEFEIIEEDGSIANLKKGDSELALADTLTKMLEEGTEEEIANFGRLLSKPWKKPLLIVALAKIGLDKPQKDYIECTKTYLSYEQSIGMIAGKPGFAYYAPGYQDDELMYLDPHYVQETLPSTHQNSAKAKQALIEQNLGTFYYKNIRRFKFVQMDTSVALCFFIRDQHDFRQFLEKISYTSGQTNSYLSVALSAPVEQKKVFPCKNRVDNEFEHI